MKPPNTAWSGPFNRLRAGREGVSLLVVTRSKRETHFPQLANMVDFYLRVNVPGW